MAAAAEQARALAAERDQLVQEAATIVALNMAEAEEKKTKGASDSNEELEELRQQWFDAPNEAEQKRICREIQADFMREPTYLPLGAYYPQTVFSAKLTGMRSGLPQFYDIRWA